jgi:hypothetical protein
LAGVWSLAESLFGGSLESGGVIVWRESGVGFCVGAFGRSLVPVAVNICSYLMIKQNVLDLQFKINDVNSHQLPRVILRY